MSKLRWTEWIVVAVTALVVALVVVGGAALGLQTYREHQALLTIVGYNLQQGRLLTLPVATPVVPAATPAPTRPEAPAKP